MIELGNRILQQQPFSVLLGARMTRFSEGQVELQVPLRPEHMQQHGFAHGGVLSYCADNALTFAAGSLLGPKVVTSEFKINYVRPALGETLIARAHVIHAGQRQAVCHCEVWVVQDGSEKLCAVAQGTIAVMDAERTHPGSVR